MSLDLIVSNVEKHITLNDKERKFFVGLLDHQHWKRKTFFLHQGEVCKSSAFVIDGALKSFSIDKDGKEHILNFATRGWWMSDLYSLISKKPSVLNIDVIDDSEIFLLTGKDQQLLYEKIPKFERFFRILIENALVANQQRLIDNLSSTAEDRYLNFLKKYPQIPSCVPQHNIASYLGITPEFLSKIRRRLAKKHP